MRNGKGGISRSQSLVTIALLPAEFRSDSSIDGLRPTSGVDFLDRLTALTWGRHIRQEEAPPPRCEPARADGSGLSARVTSKVLLHCTPTDWT